MLRCVLHRFYTITHAKSLACREDCIKVSSGISTSYLELIEKRAKVVSELKQLEEESAPLLKLFHDEEFLEKAQTSR